MRHASLALLGASVQLGALGDVDTPLTHAAVSVDDIAADHYWRMSTQARDLLAAAEKARQRYCEVKGLRFSRIEPTELAGAFKPTAMIPETLTTVAQVQTRMAMAPDSRPPQRGW